MEERLNQILHIALQYNVTDIHFDLMQKKTDTLKIEMRVNGEMRKLKSGFEDVKLFRYISYLANLDLSDASRPQTGVFTKQLDEQKLSLRFATVSSYQMMSGVLRILNHTNTITIPQLTKDEEDQQWLKTITDHRNGLFLFSGPTGSGKTTTLYTLLNDCEGKKIFTLEDPVEIVNEKYIQLQVNDAQHLSYADGIKQLMRHDPDIVMIGEIRDETVAQMACRTALTGHLVLSTIHSSSCINAIHRMEDLGVPSYQLQEVLCGISNQRLFTTKDGRKTGIYERMNQSQLNHYFEKKEVPNDMVTLNTKIHNAILNHLIDPIQAQRDLIA